MEPLDLPPPGQLIRKRSLHVVTSHRCQNDCLFCSDGGERIRIERPDPAVVRDILERNRDHDVVCFSTHEPTLHPKLETFVAWARELGYPTVSLITNGRTLARGDLIGRLVAAGLDDLHVSIHGHEAAIHDGITRREGSFAQAVAGLDAALALRDTATLRVTAHSTISALNVDALPQMVRFFLDRGVDHYGLNGLFMDGLAVENHALLAVPYPAIAAALSRALAGPVRPVSVSDIPPCQLLRRIPRWALGLREDFHMAVDAEAGTPTPTEAASQVRRFTYGAPCASCALRAQCDGVADAYIDAFGWEAYQPVTAEELDGPSTFASREQLEALLAPRSEAWEILRIDLEPRRAQVRLRGPGLSRELILLVAPLDPGAPAYRRSERYNLSLKGGDHSADEIALADAVFDQITADEPR